jgi:hypothetical protein
MIESILLLVGVVIGACIPIVIKRMDLRQDNYNKKRENKREIVLNRINQAEKYIQYLTNTTRKIIEDIVIYSIGKDKIDILSYFKKRLVKVLKDDNRISLAPAIFALEDKNLIKIYNNIVKYREEIDEIKKTVFKISEENEIEDFSEMQDKLNNLWNKELKQIGMFYNQLDIIRQNIYEEK